MAKNYSHNSDQDTVTGESEIEEKVAPAAPSQPFRVDNPYDGQGGAHTVGEDGVTRKV